MLHIPKLIWNLSCQNFYKGICGIPVGGGPFDSSSKGGGPVSVDIEEGILVGICIKIGMGILAGNRGSCGGETDVLWVGSGFGGGFRSEERGSRNSGGEEDIRIGGDKLLIKRKNDRLVLIWKRNTLKFLMRAVKFSQWNVLGKEPEANY